MKKILALLLLLVLFGFSYGTWKITVSVSESDAEIFVNGTRVGNSPQTISVRNKECVQVEIKKAGFLSQKMKFCVGVKGEQEPQKKQFITLIKDEAYMASSSTDIANIDIGVVTSKTEDKAWKLLNEVITTYFDVLEVTDKSAGYIRTSWVVEPFNGSTIRTRVIVKATSSDVGLKYKIKIQSEKSEYSNTSVKEDEKFSSWDRILKKYDNVLSELQTRLK